MTTKDSAEGLLREVLVKLHVYNAQTGFAKNLIARITAHLSQTGDGWIKCSDRLPTKKDANEHGKVYVFVDGDTAIDDFDWLHTPYALKHDAMWCRLPLPPADDKGE